VEMGDAVGVDVGTAVSEDEVADMCAKWIRFHWGDGTGLKLQTARDRFVYRTCLVERCFLAAEAKSDVVKRTRAQLANAAKLANDAGASNRAKARAFDEADAARRARAREDAKGSEANCTNEHAESSLYDLLGVSMSSSCAEIANAAKKRKAAVHPDRTRIDTLDLLQRVNAAADVLIDPVKRAIYDATLR
jgi:DnaJ domain